MQQAELETLASALGEQLRGSGQRLSCAESCTGGWLAQCVTAVAGSSQWFDCGFVTYSNAAKIDLLGVDAERLARHGAVSEAVAAEMAQGALRRSRADWAVATTGIAGPDGGSPQKPVGTVCFAWVGRLEPLAVATAHFSGARPEVRAQAVAFALRGLLERCAILRA